MATNDFLFRVYEAAKQLPRITCGCVAVLVIDDMTCFQFGLVDQEQLGELVYPTFFSSWVRWEILARQQTVKSQACRRYATGLGKSEYHLDSQEFE